MSEKQVFRVVVRALGVLVALDGASHILSIVSSFWVWPYDPPRNWPIPFAIPSVIYGLVALVASVAMIRRPEFVVRLARFERAPSGEPGDEAAG